MKCHLALPLSLLITLLTVALSTGSRLFYMLALLVLLGMLLCLLSVVLASRGLSVSVRLSEETVRRGEDAVLELTVRHRGPIPVAPLTLELASTLSESRLIRLKSAPGRPQTLRMPIHVTHVGVFPSGVRACVVEDLPGIFSRRIRPDGGLFELTVLPNTFEVEPVALAPGDPGSETMARATEDLSAPSEIRAWQPGDAMKKIHWKASARKGELLSRRFDEPVLQDVLILMDCSRPPSWGHPRAEADLRDLLLETAASVFADQVRTEHSVRLPLLGTHPVDVEKSMGLPIAFDYLARVDFSETDRFERVLLMECARLRKVGCVVVISARLTSAMVDVMIRMRRLGPSLRLYLATFAPEDVQLKTLTARLEHALVDVVFLTPKAPGPEETEAEQAKD